MKFELIPVLEWMRELYEQPRSTERFKDYLRKLQGGNKNELKLPIMAYNPMAKEHVLFNVNELIELEAETHVKAVLHSINQSFTRGKEKTIKVVLNLADDVKGGWTNRYSSDFDSKFKINALVERDFCAPYFWTSETFTLQMIKERILEYGLRTIYWQSLRKPETLKDHFEQELFVQKELGSFLGAHHKDKDSRGYLSTKNKDLVNINAFYQQYEDSDAYDLIFNFFYGDAASESLGYAPYGINEINGFDLARIQSMT